MASLAKKLIQDHRNPIVKVDVIGSKLFFKSSTEEEIEFIGKHQTNLENILNYERAERRCSRSQAIWLSENNKAKVTKKVKTLNQFGFQDKNGTYLYPEETLFLMESNRLEVTFNGISLSIQEGYDLLLKSCECDIVKYKVYKKLVSLGYRLIRYSELQRRLSKTIKTGEVETIDIGNEAQSDNYTRKRVLSTEDGINNKKSKIEVKASGDSSNTKQSQLEYIQNIFDNLRQTAPREYISIISDQAKPQYCAFLPNNKSRCNYDFNLYICEESLLKQQSNDGIPTIYAICSEGSISFYKFANVQLPIL